MKRSGFKLGPTTLFRWVLGLALLLVLVLSPAGARGQGGPLRPEMGGEHRRLQAHSHLLAVGHPYEDVYHEGHRANAGAASVLYGRAEGLAPAGAWTAGGAQTWDQGQTVENLPGEDNFFGFALALGDFDGDSFYDLAIGIPGERIGGQDRAGAVHVLYGDDGGLAARAGQFWHLNRPGLSGVAGEGDAFGHALAAADFDGDGFDDLAVSAPGYDLGPLADIGVVSILYGSADGLAMLRNQLWYQGPLVGLAGEPEPGDRFGHALAVGDFDCDGHADLAIGVPQEDLEDGRQAPDAGVVHVVHGGAEGLSAAGDQLWDQDALDLGENGAGGGDRFGHALATGDFDGDGCSDLAVGAPGEAVSGAEAITEAGALNIVYSDGEGLSPAGAQFWSQDALSSAPGGADAGDRLGHALAAGDFNADGRCDLAVGAPGEQIYGAPGAGAVSIIYGSERGLSVTIGDQFFSQPLRAGGSPAEALDHFGQALAAGDFDGNGAVDLAVGVPYEDDDRSAARDTGLVAVLYGQPGQRLASANSEDWDEGDLGGLSQEGDWFGYALATSLPPAPPCGHEVYAPLVEGDEGP